MPCKSWLSARPRRLGLLQPISSVPLPSGLFGSLPCSPPFYSLVSQHNSFRPSSRVLFWLFLWLSASHLVLVVKMPPPAISKNFEVKSKGTTNFHVFETLKTPPRFFAGRCFCEKNAKTGSFLLTSFCICIYLLVHLNMLITNQILKRKR